MQLKLDENLGRRGANIFQASGHDVITVSDQGMTSARDEQLATVCNSEQRCLITVDLDFSNPFQFPPHEYSGIAVLRQSSRFTLDELLCCCRTLVAALDQDDITGQLWIVEPLRIRKYRPDGPEPSDDR